MKKSIDNFVKRADALLLAVLIFFTGMISVLMPEIAYAGTTIVTSTKPADGSEVYLYNDGSVSYGGYSTHYYYTKESSSGEFFWQAYCADPDGGVPATGKYTIDYNVSSYTNTTSVSFEADLEEVVYQLYGQPGFSVGNLPSAVEDVLGSTDWNGDAWGAGSYYVISHLLVSSLLGADIDTVFYKTSSDFQSFFVQAGTSYGQTSSKQALNYALSLIYIRLLRFEDSDVPSDFDVYVVKTQDVSSGYQLILGSYYPQSGTIITPDYGYIELTKSSSDTSVTSGNDSYSLADATYGIYYDKACTNKYCEITTDASGVATSGKLLVGTYYIKEIDAPDGYKLADDTVTVNVNSTTSVTTVAVSDTPAYDSGTLTITKKDADTGSTAQGDASLSGAQYTICYYDDQYSSKSALPSGATRTWVIKTDSSGTAKLDSDHLISGTLYKNSSGKVVMPIGTYTITESTAPEGYTTDDAVFTVSGTPTSANFFLMNVTQSTAGGSAELNVSHNITNQDTPMKGDVEITKVDADTLTASAQGDSTDLSGARFAIYNISDHAVVVDNIIYTAGDGSADETPVITITTNAAGVAKTGTGLLPYGTYLVREVEAPEGYEVSDKTYTFSITADGQIKTLTISDEIERGGFTVAKLDSETLQAAPQGDGTLEGAEFTIYNKSEHAVVVNSTSYAVNEAIMTVATGSDGMVTFDTTTLPYGTYMVKETKAPTGYLLNEEEYTFSITKDGEKKTVTADDQIIRGGVTIYKMDENLVDLTDADTANGVAQGDAVLSGASYAIVNRSAYAVLVNNVLYDPGEVVYTLVTDENGHASTDKDGNGIDDTLPYGTYDIYEIQETDYGYLLNEDDVNTIRIREDGTVIELDGGEVVDTVERQAFQIVKISAGTAAEEVYGVEGAQFTIYNVSDSVVTLGNNVYATGTASRNNGTATVDGTTYYLGDAVETITTDSTGYACSSKLSYGTYVVRETVTPTNLNTVKDFVVTIRKESDEPQVWRYFNDSPFTAYIKVIKEDTTTGKTVLISGVSFQILNTDTGEYVTQKVGNQYIDTFYTNESGYTVTPLKLECGNYQLVEITAPYGYTVKEDAISFTVSNNTLYQVDQDNDAVITVECANDEVTGSVTVYKHGEALTGITTDADGNMVFIYEDEPLSGSTFILVADEDIYTPDMQLNADETRTIAVYNGVECYQGATVATLTSESSGYVTVEGLPLGSYHIEEIGVTEGYTISTCVDSFTLTYQDQNTAVISYSDSDYENDRVTAALTLVKTGLKSGEVIEGAAYGLYTAEDIVSYFGEVFAEAGTLIETRITDENGAISWTADLPLGQYYVQELEAAEGTIYNDAIYYVDLSYQGMSVSVVSDRIEAVNDETELDLLKLDAETGEGLSGAVLQLLDEEGTVMDEWTTDGSTHKIYRLVPGYYTVHEVSAPAGYVTFSDVTVKVLLSGDVQEIRVADQQTELHISKKEATGGEELAGAQLQILDENGNVLYEWTSTDEEYVIKKIPTGTYILHEDLAPLGYATASDVTFTVLDTGDIQCVEMIDELITVSISKKDATTGEELPGAELTLYDSEGNIVDTWTSTEEAHIITGLHAGETYTLHEDLAPLGYAVASDVIFTVADTGEIQKVEMFDEMLPETSSPKTGDVDMAGIPAMAIAGITLVGIGAYGKNRKRRRKE